MYNTRRIVCKMTIITYKDFGLVLLLVNSYCCSVILCLLSQKYSVLFQ